MAKNGQKMVEIFWGASHMIDINILTFFVSKFLVFGYFLDLVFRAIFSKFGQNTGFVKYPKEKIEEHLPFPLINWQFLQKALHGNLGETPGDRCVLILKELVGTINKDQALVEAFSGHCEIMRSPVDSSSPQTAQLRSAVTNSFKVLSSGSPRTKHGQYCQDAFA